MPLASGTRLGPYEIVAGIGSGGMGEVYRARDTRLQRDVAIKTLPAGVADDPGRRARFEREAQTISRLSHPNICAIYDIGNVGDVAFLVMEYIEGESLASRLRLGPIPWSTALPWAIEAASAIDAAHRRGIVHRDLKPANIMVGESGVKLLDFGVAKLLEKQDAGNLAETASLTREHQIVGTIHYMSPEQLEGRDIDPRTDIFAFGATLYEMLTARHAFEGTTLASVTTAVLTAEPAPIATSGATDRLPPGLEHVIRRALAKNPADRWQTSRDLMIELKAVLARALREPPLDDLPEPARQPATRRSIRLSLKTLAVAALLLIGAGATGWYVTSSRPMTLAVVPLEAATGIQEIDVLDDGITDNIISKLGEASPGRLRVIAGSSVRRYKGVKFDAQSAGRELGADMLLILRITPGPGKLSIAPELVRADNATRVWSFTYETTIANLFAAEERIAKDTLEQLHIRLNDEERRQLGKRDTENMDAYLQYVTGWALVDRQANTEVNYEQSIEFFEKATAIDPKYAAAYVGIAYAYLGLGWEGFLPPKDALTLSQEALEKAKAIDPSAVEASPVPSGQALFQWNFETTERLARQAVALKPEDPLVYKFWARELRSMGRWTEAIAAGERARRNDPLGVQSNADLGTTYAWQGDLTRAIKQYRHTLTLDPRAGPVHELLADAYARAGNFEQAIERMQEALALADLPATIVAGLGADFVTSGYEAAMKKLYQGQLNAWLAKEKAGEYVPPMAFAQIYAHLHENDNAFVHLQKALEERHPWMAVLKYDPTFAPLRNDPRFAALVSAVGIPEESWLRERWLGLLSRLGLY